MFKVRSQQSILLDAVSQLASSSAITNLAPGSKARAVMEAVANVVGNVGSDISNGVLTTLLPNATGGTLDIIGDMVGVQRLPELPARVEEADNNLRYYVATGTFGDINNGAPITVPAGTQVNTGDGRNRPEGVFTQRDTVVLPADESEVFFAADQVGEIQSKGVSPNAITRHNFTGYADSVFTSLLVSNNFAVAGRRRETDNNLRFRISQALTTRAASNEIAVRLAALLVPGVSDIRILPNRAGLGTFDVIVFGVGPLVSASVLSQVQEQIDSTQAVGSRGVAVSPRLVGISLEATITFVAGTLVSDKNAAFNAARSAIRDYIDNITAGGVFVINNLIPTIINAHPSILDVGNPNDPFNELLIWRDDDGGDGRFSRNLITNYTLRNDEDIVVEPFINNAILITEA